MGYFKRDDDKLVPKCDMTSDCLEEVSHIDLKGFIYCEECSKRRKVSHAVRKLSGHEIKEIKAGKQLSRF